MTLAFDHPPNPDSPLCRLDPRWKLAGLALTALAAALVRSLPAAAIALAGALVLVRLSRLPPRWYLARLGTVALFLALFAAPLPLLVHDGGPSCQIGPVRLSPYGLRLGLLLTCKGLAVVSLALMLLATAPLPATLQAAHALYVPGLLVQLALLTYRYVFVLAAELGRLRVALRVRGYRNRANRHSYHTVGQVAGTLLVRGAERAERVAQAMRCRGFDGRFRSLAEFRTRPRDVAFFVALAAGAAALLLWDFGRP
jgi:cobalt/nickel transport system permease protein